ncbi:MAG: hypothetical protein N3A01_03630 [Bacteroidales bacterium]|nr:hypothetical protein [Bacteroidales bacterium]
MRNLVFIVALLCNIYNKSFSQNEEDALRYSQHYYFGTSRGISTGNGLSSILADQSSIVINPASIGKYFGHEITYSPFMSINTTDALYNNATANDMKFRFQTGNLGCVLTHKNSEDTKWRNVVFGFSYNRINDFSTYVNVEGFNETSSMVDYFVLMANGKKPEQLNKFVEGLAYEAYLIDVDSNLLYHSALLGKGVIQQKSINYRGGMGEYSFSIGTNYANTLWLGMSFGIQSVRYKEYSEYEEKDPKDADKIPCFENFVYTKDLKTVGSGFNFKFGMIYAPISIIRIGVAFHTPTFFNLSNNYQFSMKTLFSDTMSYRSKNIKSLRGEYNFEVTTPFKTIGSFGLVIPKNEKPFINIGIDAEIVNYKMARLRAIDYFFKDENENIRNFYRQTANFRGGIEVIFDEIIFRGGYGIYLSPYNSAQPNKNANTNIYSGGIGIKGKSSYFDIAFFYSLCNKKYYLYDPNVIQVNPVDITYENYGIIATIGFRF